MSDAAPARPSRFPPWARRTVAVLGYGLVVVLVLRAVDKERFVQALGKLHASHIAMLFGCIACHLTLRSLRYHALVLRAHPVGYRWLDGLRIFLLGIGAAVVTPARAGDFVKAELLRPYGVRRAVGLGLILIERILDLLVIVATIVVTGTILAQRGQSSELRFGAGILLACLVAGTAIVTLRRPRQLAIGIVARGLERITKRVSRERVAEICHRIFDVWDEVFASPTTLAKYVALSSLVWFADFLKLWIILQSSDANVPLLPVLFVYPLSLVAGVITLLPFGEGVVGVTAVAVLRILVDVDVETATAAVIVDRAASTLAPVLAYVVLGAHGSIRDLRRHRAAAETKEVQPNLQPPS